MAPSREKLLNHISIHHRDEKCNVVLTCMLCHALFDNYDNLIAHRKENHGSSQMEMLHFEGNEAKLFYQQLLLESEHAYKLEESLQLKAAEFLHNLHENTTQTVIDSVIKGSDVLFDSVLDIFQSKFCQLTRNSQDKTLSLNEISKTLDGFRRNSIFQGLETQKLYASYLQQKNWLVPPNQLVLNQKEVLGKNNIVKKVPVDFGYTVGFLPLLEKLLNLPEVLQCIDNPKFSDNGTFASPLDGYYYRNHPVVLNNPGPTLAFGTYVDDAKLTDTASTKPLNGRFFYWNLLNLYPELRSSTRAINLLFCGQTEIVKTYGFEKFLQDYFEGIKKLSSKEGVRFTIMCQKRTFHGIHLFSSGDNPASSNLGGFKESHFADLLCRQCMGTKPDIYLLFLETDFTLRSKQSHKDHVDEIDAYQKLPTSVQKELKNPSAKYGVNRRSAFMEIESCDVTKQFPQDIMHDTIHGTLKLEIICLLDHAITQTKSIDLKTVNDRISRYTKFFGANKPAAIEHSHLQNQNLRHSASETLVLANVLPFVLIENEDLNSGVISVCSKENLKCFILRLNLLHAQMATQFTIQDIENLRKLTRIHHKLFLKCYPDAQIPKLHYEIHYGTQILLFGPLRQQWCFRFEGKHAEFKRIWKMCHNSINLYYTLASRHQSRQAAQMLLSVERNAGPYLKTANYSSVPKRMKITQLSKEHQDLLLSGIFKELQPSNASSLNKHVFAVVNGVHYSNRDAFVLDFVNGVPTVGEIISIYSYKEETAFLYAKLVTDCYVQNLNAFKVKHSKELGIALTTQIVHHQSIPYIRSVNAHYVVVTCRSFLTTLMS